MTQYTGIEKDMLRCVRREERYHNYIGTICNIVTSQTQVALRWWMWGPKTNLLRVPSNLVWHCLPSWSGSGREKKSAQPAASSPGTDRWNRLQALKFKAVFIIVSVFFEDESANQQQTPLHVWGLSICVWLISRSDTVYSTSSHGINYWIGLVRKRQIKHIVSHWAWSYLWTLTLDE